MVWWEIEFLWMRLKFVNGGLREKVWRRRKRVWTAAKFLGQGWFNKRSNLVKSELTLVKDPCIPFMDGTRTMCIWLCWFYCQVNVVKIRDWKNSRCLFELHADCLWKAHRTCEIDYDDTNFQFGNKQDTRTKAHTHGPHEA